LLEYRICIIIQLSEYSQKSWEQHILTKDEHKFYGTSRIILAGRKVLEIYGIESVKQRTLPHIQVRGLLQLLNVNIFPP
jgi:hypothetical protein